MRIRASYLAAVEGVDSVSRTAELVMLRFASWMVRCGQGNSGFRFPTSPLETRNGHIHDRPSRRGRGGLGPPARRSCADNIPIALSGHEARRSARDGRDRDSIIDFAKRCLGLALGSTRSWRSNTSREPAEPLG